MEWKTMPVPTYPKVGQHRERLAFAWWPIACADKMTRWLCRVRLLEMWTPRGWFRVAAYRGEIEMQARQE
jgi:hypothetical protein